VVLTAPERPQSEAGGAQKTALGFSARGSRVVDQINMMQCWKLKLIRLSADAAVYNVLLAFTSLY
jgi:hypothetical protein